MTHDHRDSGHAADVRGQDTLLSALLQRLAELRSETIHHSDGTISPRWNRDDISKFETAVVKAGSWYASRDALETVVDEETKRTYRTNMRTATVLLGVAVLAVLGSLFLLISKYS